MNAVENQFSLNRGASRKQIPISFLTRLPLALASALRKRGYGAGHTGEEGRLGTPDKSLLP